MIDVIKRSSVAKEVSGNRRLQWLLLVILIIVMSSCVKYLFDKNNRLEAELVAQQRLTARLQASLNSPIDDGYINDIQIHSQAALEAIPSVNAFSLAEATAISEADELRDAVFIDGRARLIGTEQIRWGEHLFYQVRVELVGRHNLLNFIELLASFDGLIAHQRLLTLQMTTGRRDSNLTVVIDYLYRQEGE